MKMNYANIQLRSEMSSLFITGRDLAKAIGVTNVSISRWLAEPLSDKKEKMIRNAIEKIIDERMKSTSNNEWFQTLYANRDVRRN